MNNKFIIILPALFLLLIFPSLVKAESAYKGKIFLQVESNGQAWYVAPDNGKRYFLGRPDDAFTLMKKLSLGISNYDFNKLKNKVSDNLLGKIVIKVNDHGRAYYLDPANKKLYYLGRPLDAYNIMRDRGIGITNKNLNKIPVGSIVSLVANGNDTDLFIYNGYSLKISDLESDIKKLVNTERKAKNLASFVDDEELSSIARSHSQDMSKQNYFSNTDTSGCDTLCRFKNNDYLYKKIAESIATGYVYKYRYADGGFSEFRSASEIAETILKAWESNDHIYAKEYTNQGIGVAVDREGKIYVTSDLSLPIITAGQGTELKEFVKTIISTDDSQKDKIKKIYDWITGNIGYDIKNYLNNTVPDESFLPYGTYHNRQGVCQGYAELLRLLLGYAGIKSEVVSGTADGFSGFASHAWNKVNLEGEELYIDSSWGAGYVQNNDFIQKPNYNYYLVTGKCIRADHFLDNQKQFGDTEQKQYVRDNMSVFDQKCPLLRDKILDK